MPVQAYRTEVDQICRLARLGLPDRAMLSAGWSAHAAQWRAAADADDGSATFLLAMCLSEGIGAPADQEAAAQKFSIAAHQGCTAALVRLAAAYAAGAGVNRDQATAVYLDRQAATAGDPDGMARLAIDYASGSGLAADSAQAVRWYRAAADAGNPVGHTGLSDAYRLGDGVERDPVESARQMGLAVDAGSTLAMIAVGDRYAHGDEQAAPDLAAAAAWYRRAADLGSTAAMLRMSDLCLARPRAGGGGPTPHAATEVARPTGGSSAAVGSDSAGDAGAAHGVEVDRRADLVGFVDWTRRAVAAGDPDALMRMADLHALGLPPIVKVDPPAAIAEYRRAADAGNTAALARLGYAYEIGWCVPRTPTAARDCYARGATDGDSDCMVALANTYDARFPGVDHDPGTELFWYQRAAATGDPAGMLGLASCYLRGVGQRADVASAAHWFTEAAARGNGAAMTNMGLLYKRGFGVGLNPTAAAAWFRQAAEHGDGTGMRHLARSYAEGSGVPMDGARAVTLYKLSINALQGQGDRQRAAEVMGDLGQLYLAGRAVPRDTEAALQWLRKGAAAKDPVSTRVLADLSANGDGVRRDPEAALAMYRRAGGLGDVPSMLAVGRYRQDGVGGPPDDREAYEWYFRAANAGSAEAADRIGLLFVSGRQKFPHHMPTAAQWFKQSADGGDPVGAGHLSQLVAAGLGTAQDLKRAEKLAVQADLGHHPEFLTLLGDLLCRGWGSVPSDLKLAGKCYQLAAAHGDRSAAAKLAALRAGTPVIPTGPLPLPTGATPAPTVPSAATSQPGLPIVTRP